MPLDDPVAAVRAVYDASTDRYVRFVGTEISPATEGAIDRALLEAFAARIEPRSTGPVVDVGCGPGRVAAFLAQRSVDAIGVDVSLAMLGQARRAHPHISLQQSSLDALPLADRSCRGAVGWYSIIHTPPSRLGLVLTEIRRILKPGGQLMLAFQAGAGEAVSRADAHGTGLALTSYRHLVTNIEQHLDDAGFRLHATMVRSPTFAHETTPQAFVIASREPASGS